MLEHTMHRQTFEEPIWMACRSSVLERYGIVGSTGVATCVIANA